MNLRSATYLLVRTSQLHGPRPRSFPRYLKVKDKHRFVFASFFQFCQNSWNHKGSIHPRSTIPELHLPFCAMHVSTEPRHFISTQLFPVLLLIHSVICYQLLNSFSTFLTTLRQTCPKTKKHGRIEMKDTSDTLLAEAKYNKNTTNLSW